MNRHLSLQLAGALRTLLTLLLLGGLGCVKRPVDYEREYARTLAPKRLEGASSAPTTGPRRTLHVRVYADADASEPREGASLPSVWRTPWDEALAPALPCSAGVAR